MSNTPSVTLIVTATVDPATREHVVRADPSVRLVDYRWSLQHWFALARTKRWSILILENSGWDLDDLTHGAQPDDLAHVPYRAVSVPSRPQVEFRGKGYGEAEMYDRVAQLIDPDPRSLLVKATGRLIVSNASHLVEDHPRRHPFIRCRSRLDGSEVDTRFFVTDSATWHRHLTGLGESVDEANGIYLEHAVASRLRAAQGSTTHVLPFRQPPKVRGHSGSTGQAYGGRRQAVMDALGNTLCRIRSSLYG